MEQDNANQIARHTCKGGDREIGKMETPMIIKKNMKTLTGR